MRNNILIVDDDPFVAKAIQRLLQRSGLACVIAKSAERALFLLDQLEIDVVLTDNRMPNMSGYELLSIVKKKFSFIGCALVTAFPETIETSTLVNSGVVDKYFTKPWSPESLASEVKSLLLAQHQKRMETRRASQLKSNAERLQKYCDITNFLKYPFFCAHINSTEERERPDQTNFDKLLLFSFQMNNLAAIQHHGGVLATTKFIKDFSVYISDESPEGCIWGHIDRGHWVCAQRLLPEPKSFSDYSEANAIGKLYAKAVNHFIRYSDDTVADLHINFGGVISRLSQATDPIAIDTLLYHSEEARLKAAQDNMPFSIVDYSHLYCVDTSFSVSCV